MMNMTNVMQSFSSDLVLKVLEYFAWCRSPKVLGDLVEISEKKNKVVSEHAWGKRRTKRRVVRCVYVCMRVYGTQRDWGSSPFLFWGQGCQSVRPG